MSTKHTPGPWEIIDDSSFICKKESDSHVFPKIICRFFDSYEEQYKNTEANAARIVACVNAMDGIDDPQKLRQAWEICKQLELDQAQKYKEQRDELLFALTQLKSWVGKLSDWGGEDPPCDIVDAAIKKATE